MPARDPLRASFVLALSVATAAAAVSAWVRPARADEPPPVTPITPPPGEPQEPQAVPPPPPPGGPATAPPPRRRGHFPTGTFLPVGVGLAGTAHTTSGTGLAIGVEASVVEWPIGEGNWIGAYGDALYDTGSSRARFSVGGEVGYMMLGVDGGLVVQTGGGRTDLGWVVRPMLSLGLFHIYARFGGVPKDPVDPHFREIGVLFKFPILLDDH